MADLTPLAESVHCRITKIVAVHNAASMTHMAYIFQPDEIRLTYYASNGSPTRPEVVVSGPRILKDGRHGQRVNHRIFSTERPDWVQVAVDAFAPDWEEVKLSGTR